jgi:glycosyltransferase involved in cell wall biosynthesis
MHEFPRVLFITPVAFNPYSGGGATFTSLFLGWPKDRLATIHNDYFPSPDNVCENYFLLGLEELDFIPLFSALRRRRANKVIPSGARADIKDKPRQRWLDAARELILGDSVPEQARLTAHLASWIERFRPDVIYTILGSNGMMSLIQQIQAQFDLPIVVHIMDDWANAAHRKGLFAPLERRVMKRQLAHFFETATARLGISPAMCEAYARRYGRPFTPFQYALDLQRWGDVSKRDLSVRNIPEISYVGSIFRNAQLNSLIDCAHAVAALNDEGFPLRLKISTSASNVARFGKLLSVHPRITLDAAAVSDDTFFQGLAEADALLLPVNFDRASVDFIRYSMPTKVPAYLNSGTPVLAYGSSETAQIRYATDRRWALVVSNRSMDTLKDALKRIISDMSLRKELSGAARCAAADHDASTVRTGFQEVLRQAARRQDGTVPGDVRG